MAARFLIAKEENSRKPWKVVDWNKESPLSEVARFRTHEEAILHVDLVLWGERLDLWQPRYSRGFSYAYRR